MHTGGGGVNDNDDTILKLYTDLVLKTNVNAVHHIQSRDQSTTAVSEQTDRRRMMDARSLGSPL
jgi:hypothetical protein